MNRFWGHSLSSALVAAAAACTFPACAHNDGSLYVHGVLAPPQPNGTTCTYTADPTAPEISRGLVDAAITNSYSPEFLLAGQILSRASAPTIRAETSVITIQGVDVRVVDPTTNAQITNVDVLAAGIVEASVGATPAYTAMGAPIMDAVAVSHFDPGVSATTGLANAAKLAEVYVKFYGQTIGGDYVESDEFLFPVDVCHGCLVSFPAGVTDLADYCKGALASQATTQPCVVGQDQPVDCQRCYGAPVCSP